MTHFYNRDGLLVKPGTGFVSPTTVLAIRRNPGLQGWRDRVGPEQADSISKTATDQGTLVHGILERLSQGLTIHGLSSSSATVQAMVGGYQRWVETSQPTDMVNEMFVLSEEDGYAGRLDLLCKIAGEWWIVDYKTSKQFRPSMGLQLVAYKNALLDMIKRGAVPAELLSVTHIRTGILQVTDQIKRGYRFKEYDEPYEVFKAHLTIFKWEQVNEPPDYPWEGGLIYV